MTQVCVTSYIQVNSSPKSKRVGVLHKNRTVELTPPVGLLTEQTKEKYVHRDQNKGDHGNTF